ncbi:ABC transporter permease [Agrobacterium rosae]|uniref:Iron ABC transporter permease n=1 Tax=Agrobacterium rosae TaxID=1972867 RepID=A0AAE5RX03_9HYPH|nr:iron ABC transporter permease [Agrobacterium rosae]KAA3514115.1 iron ABC transporter permease [Agrobacterium rosae]KAA3522783.1 iron ABC transporter permease [Agrobacterium rosae]MCM2433952.1 iron ABC transporter permease [Agrobacterium rosae]MDX8330494.1 iron ABC transporter permease [Agrobacterium rosae]MQB47453.1 iron ABC transporter permease [Agrobacterium rosae]
MPLIAIFCIAATGGTDGWRHLLVNVLPRAGAQTLMLLVMTGLVTACFGILTAWLVSTFQFPLRRILSFALVLPLAIPSYLAAYAFGEFLDFTGPVQTAVRTLFGYHTVRDYWFPDIRSLGGAVLVLSSVLYPYVYLSVRAAFGLQGRFAAEAARTLGAGPVRIFLSVQLPMARPAIIIGLALVMMETLNDIGAVEYLGVRTLTFAIYETWLNRGNLAGATQIASVLVIIVAALIFIERKARSRQRFAAAKSTAMSQRFGLKPLPAGRGLAATVFCLLPVLSGFAIPVLVLGGYAVKRLGALADPKLVKALAHSLEVSLSAALITLVCGFIFAYVQRVNASSTARCASRIGSLGYGIPGTVLAIGVLLPLAALDNALDGFLRRHLNYSTGLLLSGTAFAIIYAHSVRFMTLAEGTIDAGFQKLSPHLDMAARTLGRNRFQTLITVLLPNIRPAAITAALLVFIESLKELPATIMLRPFNFNTLATLVYEDASRSKVQDASIPALIIIMAGLIPVLLVSRSLDHRADDGR